MRQKKTYDHLNGHRRIHRGSAHSICNLPVKVYSFFFHNFKKDYISVIEQTKEKYISFSKSIPVEKIINYECKEEIYLHQIKIFRLISVFK